MSKPFRERWLRIIRNKLGCRGHCEYLPFWHVGYSGRGITRAYILEEDGVRITVSRTDVLTTDYDPLVKMIKEKFDAAFDAGKETTNEVKPSNSD